jgi:hypothetical protein
MVQKTDSLRGRVGGRGKPSSEVMNRLGFAIAMNGSKGEEKFSMTFTIGVNLIKEMRWQVGDRIDIQRDPVSNLGLLRRIKDGGRSLAATGSRKKAGTCTLAMVYRPNLYPLIDISKHRSIVSLEQVEVTNEGILFQWPVDKQEEGRLPIANSMP